MTKKYVDEELHPSEFNRRWRPVGGHPPLYENWRSGFVLTNQQAGKRRRGEREGQLCFRAYSDDPKGGV